MKLSIQDILGKKSGQEKITCLTAYDYPSALLVDRAGIDMIIVGDSLANVILGLTSTKEVGIEDILYHAKAVTRAATHALVIADMPFSAYQTEPDKAKDNAKKLTEEGGCSAVKVEWFDQCINVTRSIIGSGIPVMGHIGLTPQTADKIGGFKVQGKDAEQAATLLKQAKLFEEAGCFSLVLECVPDKIAGLITEKLSIPTIGIGAGPYCDGQVLVLHDILGLSFGFKPKFIKQYADVSEITLEAINTYKNEVLRGTFPDKSHSFSISDEEFLKLKNSTPDEKETY